MLCLSCPRTVSSRGCSPRAVTSWLSEAWHKRHALAQLVACSYPASWGNGIDTGTSDGQRGGVVQKQLALVGTSFSIDCGQKSAELFADPGLLPDWFMAD